MRSVTVSACILAFLWASAARAADCPGHPGAIGTSRTIYVDPAEHPRIGGMQYSETLPLRDHEVVLTFDDGPLPPKTTRVLDILASECVKATFFIVGRMAHDFPAVLRREYAEGHSIGTHSQNHPLDFERAPIEKVAAEVDEGIASVTAALGDPKDVAPFFRNPGLEHQDSTDDYINSHGLMVWSADFPADDWKHIKAAEIYRRAITRIEAKHRGILLLHDIQPQTVLALPMILNELKRRGYHIVHVAPATPDEPKTATEPSEWAIAGKKPSWTPEVVSVDPEPVVPALADTTLMPPSSAAPPAPTPAAPATTSFVPAQLSSAPATATTLGPPIAIVPTTSNVAAPNSATSNTASLNAAAPTVVTPERPALLLQPGTIEPPHRTANVPLPPERPRILTKRAALPTPKPVGHMGMTPETAPERSEHEHAGEHSEREHKDAHQELTTGSIAPVHAAEPAPMPVPQVSSSPPSEPASADADGPIIRPSADIPTAKPAQ
jgi:peptidoglycan/xylan/chitin deacetylase (PgdA/CDA1 family)